jgi:hypothetical protein
MASTYVTVLKQNAEIKVPFCPSDIFNLQTILLKHLDKKIHLDQESWEIIESICERVDLCAKEQNQTVEQEVKF